MVMVAQWHMFIPLRKSESHGDSWTPCKSVQVFWPSLRALISANRRSVDTWLSALCSQRAVVLDVSIASNPCRLTAQ